MRSWCLESRTAVGFFLPLAFGGGITTLAASVTQKNGATGVVVTVASGPVSRSTNTGLVSQIAAGSTKPAIATAKPIVLSSGGGTRLAKAQNRCW
jgi:hypothetical protein